MEAGERFARVLEQLAERPGVEAPSGSRHRFGSDALKINGSIFAMVTGRRLVVKLPSHRVEAFIASGTGAPFDAGKGGR